ncbi:MAG TPA: TlpA family protein disulfide reductase [Candidatus Acidoferrum sp.]|nr:TlpA family protein disulfide reductase [Candidatus Acidoferrum sp.]
MKKALLVVATVLALIIGTYFADKATRIKTTVNGTSVKADGGDPDDQATGQPEPELTLKDLNGVDVSLSDYKGKVVLVNFWATWCEPCRIEIPWLIEMQQKYGPKGFEILGIALDQDGKSKVAPFVAKERFDVNGVKEPMSYKILIGNEEATDKFGGLFGYPTSILISRDGKQVKRITGMISYDEMAQAIEAQLGKS